MSSRKCKYDADAFCFICGQFIKVRDVKYELKTSHVLCEAYEAYFDWPIQWKHDGDYIWGLLRESSYEHKRKSKSVHF